MRVVFFNSKKNYVFCKENRKGGNVRTCINSDFSYTLAMVLSIIENLAEYKHVPATAICGMLYKVATKREEKEPPEAGTSDGSNEQ